MFKSTREMANVNEFVQKFSPKNHNEQDVVYLKLRYQWEMVGINMKKDVFTKEVCRSVSEIWKEKDLIWDKMAEVYKGTTFYLKNNDGVLDIQASNLAIQEITKTQSGQQFLF